MIENDYPIPSYMADIFEKPPGWLETPEPTTLDAKDKGNVKQKIYAMDCEMVCLNSLEITHRCSSIVVPD